MKRLQHYVDLEKATDDEDVGDMYAGQSVLKEATLSMYDSDTNDLFARIEFPQLSLDFGYLNCPVFCMFMLDWRNHVSHELDGNTLKVSYQFTKTQQQKLANFGESALIINNANEFVNRVKKGFLASGIPFVRKPVSYYDSNSVEQMKDVQDDDYKVAFWKREKHSHQQEYRFMAGIEVDDHLKIDIGDISDITTIVPTKKLLELTFDVNATVAINE